MTKLPSILARLRVLWTISTFYNDAERMTMLFKRVSNDIVNTCTHFIDKISCVLESPTDTIRQIEVLDISFDTSDIHTLSRHLEAFPQNRHRLSTVHVRSEEFFGQDHLHRT